MKLSLYVLISIILNFYGILIVDIIKNVGDGGGIFFGVKRLCCVYKLGGMLV